MNAVDIKRVDLSSIEAGLEHTLKQIKAGAFSHASACILVIGRIDGTAHVRGYGVRSSPLEMDGWLARALQPSAETWTAPQSGSAA